VFFPSAQPTLYHNLAAKSHFAELLSTVIYSVGRSLIQKKIIYNGRKVYDDDRTLGRITVTKSEGAERDSVDLQIDSVQMDDAGLYECFNPGKYSEGSHAELVVVDPLSLTFARKTVSHTTVEHSCSVRYSGNLNPTVEWIDSNGMVMIFDGLVKDTLPSDDGDNVTAFKIVLPSSDSLSTWPCTCQLKFTLRNRCTGEVTTEIVSHPYNNNITTGGASYTDPLKFANRFDKNQLIYFCVTSFTLNVLLLLSLIIFCFFYRRHRRGLMKISQSTRDTNSMDSENPLIVSSADNNEKSNHTYDEISTAYYQQLQLRQETDSKSQPNASFYSSLAIVAKMQHPDKCNENVQDIKI
jgi:hypothetical protein